MREQREESEWIQRCQRRVRLKRGYTKDLCCHLFLVVVDYVTELAIEGVLRHL